MLGQRLEAVHGGGEHGHGGGGRPRQGRRREPLLRGRAPLKLHWWSLTRVLLRFKLPLIDRAGHHLELKEK